MTTKYDKIKELLKGIKGFLEKYNDQKWPPWFSEQIKELESPWSNETKVLQELVGLFGGMGSFNDLYLCKENGHIIDNENAANRELDNLRGQLYQELKRVGAFIR